jgi:hypothetical protein
MAERIYVGFGSSDDPDARRAGAAAAQAAVDGCGGEPNVAFVYTTVDYDLQELLAGVTSKTGVAPVHGSTSFTGILAPNGYLAADKGVVGVLAMSTPYIEFGLGYSEIGADAVAAGRAAAKMAVAQPDVPGGMPEAVWLSATLGSEEGVLRGINEVLGEDVPILGGTAADNSLEGKWRVFANQTVMSNGVVLTAMFSHLPMGYAYGGGYRATDKKAVVTKASGRTLYQLNGRPALEIYANWIGSTREDLQGSAILGASTLHPIAVYDADADFYAVKHPVGAARDSSITLAAEIKDGDEITLMDASADELIAAVPTVIEQAMDMANLEREDVAALLFIHCGGRRGALGDRIVEVPPQIRKMVGDAPFISGMTFGEQGNLSTGRNVHCDLLLSALVIGK